LGIKNPLVSVKTIAFNQIDYIENCIEGVLMQKTDFVFEYIISDDGSKDGTREFIEKYAEKYPQIIRNISPSRNLGAVDNGIRVRKACRGKYQASCEGDDYWTDPHKLQKQIDFLETNPKFGLVHSNGYLHYIKGNRRSIFNDSIKENEYLSLNNSNVLEQILLGEYNILTCSVCLRGEFLKDIDFSEIKNLKSGDTALWLEYASRANVYYMNEPMVVHNILTESASKSKNHKKLLAFSKSGFEMEKYYIKKFSLEESVLKKVAIRRNKIFLKIAFDGQLYDEGLEAYNNLKENLIQKSIGYKPKLQYLGLKYPLLHSSISFMIFFHQRLTILFLKIFSFLGWNNTK